MAKEKEEKKKPETTRERAIRFGIVKPRIKKNADTKKE